MAEEIFARVNPEHIDILNKLIEAYDNLGIVSTVDKNEGKVVIRVTRDTCSQMMDILHNLPFAIDIQMHSE